MTFRFYIDFMPDWFMDAVSNHTVTLHNCNYNRYSIDEAYCIVHNVEGYIMFRGGDIISIKEVCK